MNSNFIAEIFLTSNHVTEDAWLSFILHINQLNGLFKKWKLYIVIDKRHVRYFIQTRHEIPSIINALGDFLIKNIDSHTKIKSIPGFFYYISNQKHCVLDIYDHDEAKHAFFLKIAELTFLPYCPSNYLSSTNLYFQNKFSKGNRLLKRKALFNIPHLFLSIDFSIHHRFFYKKDAEKYLNIQKSLHLLQSDKEHAILKIDTFPYLSGYYYLHQNHYDFDKHSIVIGSSGTGKSKFLCSFIQNILENPTYFLKYKVVVIDPHADMENNIGGLENTNVIDFKNLENSINLFTNSAQNSNASTELILSLFKTLIADQYNAKLERMLRHSIHLLLSNNALNFTNLRKLLLESEYRNYLINQSPEELSSSTTDFFLSDFNKLKTKSYLEAIAPIISFIDEMQLLPAFQSVNEKQDLKQTIQKHALTIFSLDQTILGEKVTKTIAGFIMQQLLQLVQSHSFQEHIIFIVDEVSVVENPILQRFLAEARKYNLSLILAQQYFSQISEALRTSIFANMINYYVFRVSRADALLLESNMQMEVAVNNSYKIKMKLLTELPNRECIVRIGYQGVVLPALKGKSLDFVPVPYTKKNQILDEHLLQKNFSKEKEEKNIFKKSFSIGSSVILKDLMASQSSGRKKVNPTHE